MRNTSAKDAIEQLPKQKISAPQKNSKKEINKRIITLPNKFLFLKNIFNKHTQNNQQYTH